MTSANDAGGRLRVLFIGPLPEPVTGQSLACGVLLHALEPRHDVEVVNLSKDGFRQGVSSLSRIRQVAQIVYRVWRSQRRADVIYFTISESIAGNLKDLLIYFACRKRLRSMVVHLHGGAGYRRILHSRGWMLRSLNRLALGRVGRVIVLGRRHVDIFTSALPATSISIVPNFAQDYLFSTDERVREKFDVIRPLRVLYLSNLLPGKGYEELLQAYIGLPAAIRSRVVVDFAGGFESAAARDAFVTQIAGEPGISYHGSVGGAEKQRLFQAAHVFCLPTYYPYEGQPISILEAYASGCAVITTDHSGIGDVFVNGVNGLEVKKESVEDLQRALVEAAAESTRLCGAALANLRLARVQYRTQHYQERLLALIEGAAQPASSARVLRSSVSSTSTG